MEENEMINLLTEHATNERLDKLDSSREIQKIIDRYDSATHEAAALYASLAYQQGLKDMFNLFMSLQDKKEDIKKA